MPSLLFRFKKSFVNGPLAAPEAVYEDFRQLLTKNPYSRKSAEDINSRLVRVCGKWWWTRVSRAPAMGL